MKKSVYLLQHSYSYGKHLEYEETTIIGIYSLREEAVAIIEKYKLLPGFKDYDISCFHIDKYILGDSNWQEGFEEE